MSIQFNMKFIMFTNHLVTGLQLCIKVKLTIALIRLFNDMKTSVQQVVFGVV